MSPKILIACNSRGRMMDTCLTHSPVGTYVWGLCSDHQSGSVDVARRHGLETRVINQPDDKLFSRALLEWCQTEKVDYIVSTGFTRLFRGEILDIYAGRLLNTHFSLLPAFPGHRHSDWTARDLPPRKIFERMQAYGVRIMGNTVHVIDRSVDGGTPVMQSSLVVPYDEAPETTRHRLFLQECQCLMQTVLWLVQGRLICDPKTTRIQNASFDSEIFSPAIEESWIRNFDVPFSGEDMRGSDENKRIY